MAKKSSRNAMSRDICTFFASCVDCFLGEFKAAILAGDRTAAVTATGRLSQIGLSMFETWSAATEAMAGSDSDQRSAHEAAILVREMVEKEMEKWYQQTPGKDRPN